MSSFLAGRPLQSEPAGARPAGLVNRVKDLFRKS